MARTAVPSPPTVGDPVPSFEARDARDRPLTSDGLRGRPAVLVFLRHLGCPICQMELVTLAERFPAFAERDAALVVVVESPRDRAAAFVAGRDVPYRLVPDPERELYARFGMARGGLTQFVAPGAVLKTLKATARGHLHGRFEGSELQLPGEVVADAEGVVRHVRVGRHVGDTASVEQLLATLDAL